eukprot:PITA_13318
MTLEEAFTREKPHVAHLRIFGCLTYSYIPKEQRTKLEPMTEKGSSRTGAGTGIPGSVGRPSGSPDWGEEDEVPYGEASLGKRRPKWLQGALKEIESIGPSKRVNMESVPPERFCSYVAKATSIIDSEPTSYEAVVSQEVWREAMVEEYAFIIKKNV